MEASMSCAVKVLVRPLTSDLCVCLLPLCLESLWKRQVLKKKKHFLKNLPFVMSKRALTAPQNPVWTSPFSVWLILVASQTHLDLIRSAVLTGGCNPETLGVYVTRGLMIKNKKAASHFFFFLFFYTSYKKKPLFVFVIACRRQKMSCIFFRLIPR